MSNKLFGQLLYKFRLLKNKILPMGTRRRNVYHWFINPIKSLQEFLFKNTGIKSPAQKFPNPRNNKILCIVLIYYDFEVIKKSLEFLLKFTDKLDLIVIENKSPFTDKLIKPYLLELIQQKKVSHYILFDNNISNNALEVFFDSKILDLYNYKYVILTDGDLIVDNADWLTEEINIIENNPVIFACAVSLDTSNLPVKTFPDAMKWIPPVIKEHTNYFEALTGIHFLLMRTTDLGNYLAYRKDHHLKLVDATLHHYCYEVINKKWARTKKSLARHLTWDSYHNLEHPYTKLKLSKTANEWWHHELYSSYTVYVAGITYNSTALHDVAPSHKKLMLHAGCGNIYFDGWINIDIDSPETDLTHDLRNPLPYAANSVDFIYNEHLIEHLTLKETIGVLSDFYRVLKKGGNLRVATPDLDYLVAQYFASSWKKQEWITKYGYEWIQTRAEMLNIALREWGHQYVYNEEELARRLKEVGFTAIIRKQINESTHQEFQNRETRADSKLILEAVK